MDHAEYQNVTLETVDQAVNDWFDKVVDSHVYDANRTRKKVTVSFSSGERWISSREKKALRDKNGVLVLPIISIRRTGIEPDVSMSALGVETAKIQLSKKISGKTNDLMNLNVNRDASQRIPAKPAVYEVTTIPFPNRSVLTYDVQIQTQYIVQMNSIIEKIVHELDLRNSFVAPLENKKKHAQVGVDFESRKPMDRGYVVGFFDSTLGDGGNLEEFTDQERIVRFNTTIRVPAVLQLDPEGEQPAIQVERTAFNINFGSETVSFLDNQEDIDKIFGK